MQRPARAERARSSLFTTRPAVYDSGAIARPMSASSPMVPRAPASSMWSPNGMARTIMRMPWPTRITVSRSDRPSSIALRLMLRNIQPGR